MNVLYWSDEWGVDKDYVCSLIEKYKEIDSKRLLEIFLTDEMPNKVALVSSFGAEAAILLHMLSEIDKNAPVVFIDTDKHFPETQTYRERLADQLGLTNIQIAKPNEIDVTQTDRTGDLWNVDPDTCCDLRKTQPLQRALQPYHAWITGRKRAHGGSRTKLPLIEMSSGRVKLNPLAFWVPEDVKAYFTVHNLPEHPLMADGYTSIGCAPCTAKPLCQGEVRSGRWANNENKTECGIHFENGKTVRTAQSEN